MPFPLLAQIGIGVALQIIGFLLMPKPKAPPPPSTDDLENPVVAEGQEIPVVFGTITIKDPAIIWWGQKQSRSRTIESDKK